MSLGPPPNSNLPSPSLTRPTPSPFSSQSLSPTTIAALQLHMHHKPCIVCDAAHTAWNCDKLTGPIVIGAWIHRKENVEVGMGRRARRLVERWVREGTKNDRKTVLVEGGRKFDTAEGGKGSEVAAEKGGDGKDVKEPVKNDAVGTTENGDFGAAGGKDDSSEGR